MVMEEQILASSSAAAAATQKDLSGSSGSGGARYKLVAPAKLPISRSACITIPPGLSPSSFLESPVLLSVVKVRAASFFLEVGSVLGYACFLRK